MAMADCMPISASRWSNINAASGDQSRRYFELEPGIRVGNLQQLNERFKCTHCKLLLRDAMQGDCGHRYCKNCVQSVWKEAQASSTQSQCAACKDEEDPGIISPDRTYPDHAIRREIKRLKVQCPHESCSEQMPLKELKDHELACPMRPQACRRCQAKVPRARMDEHERSECSKRPIECDACGDEVPHDELDEHKRNACVGSTRQCEFCGVRVKDDDAEMDEHLRSDCKVGWHRDNQCPYGCGSVENWQQHRAECVPKHLDRTLARVVELEKSAKAAKAAFESPADESPQLSVAEAAASASEGSGPAPPPAVVSVGDIGQVKEELTKVRQVTQELQRVTQTLPVPEDGQVVQELMNRMREVDSRDNIDKILERISEYFHVCEDSVKRHKEKLRRNLRRKYEEEKKFQELVKELAYKEVHIEDLERRIEVMEHASYDGMLVWKITDIKRRREEAREGKVSSVYSPPFYTGKSGYKMRGRLYLNGDGAGKDTHISIFFVIMRGEFDALLPWPFAKKVSMMLLDQNTEEHVIDAFKPDSSSSSFKRPTTEMNIASGCPLFMPIADFENASKGYVKEDAMFIKIIVDKSDLPS